MVTVDIIQHKNDRFMWIDGYLWMFDTEQERILQKNLADKAFGNVLVAGYGFGILTKMLLKNPNVKSVTTSEKYKEVIDEIKKTDKIYGEIIACDFYKLPENKKYDCIIGDIWPDISEEFLCDYVKFKNKSIKLLNKNGIILAWGKEFFEFLLKKKLK